MTPLVTRGEAAAATSLTRGLEALAAVFLVADATDAPEALLDGFRVARGEGLALALTAELDLITVNCICAPAAFENG